jgi:hypothetical protein
MRYHMKLYLQKYSMLVLSLEKSQLDKIKEFNKLVQFWI